MNKKTSTFSWQGLLKAALVCSLLLPLVLPAAVTVAGKNAQYKSIVLPAQATEAEKYAAEELAAYLQKVTGQKFTITTQDSPDGIKLVFDSKLDREAWKLENVNGKLTISGGRPRGVLYGVYDFLEKYAKVRWLDENNEVVPHLAAVTVPDNLKFTGKPAFDYRQIYDFARVTGEKHLIFRTRARLNNYWGGNKARYGFIERTGQPGGCHTCFNYSQGFPDDWYSMDKNGKRQKAVSGVGPGNVCFSKPEVRKAFADKLRGYIAADRKDSAAKKIEPARYFDISVNDNSDCCYCPECKKLIAKYGESGLFVDFINAIANDIKKDYPDVTIISLGYGCALLAPKNIRLADNVLMRIGQLGPELRMDAPRDTLRKLSTELNKPSLDSWKGWARQAKQLGTWDYWILYGEPFCSPHTMAPALKEIMQTYKKLNCNFIFAEAENYKGGYISINLQSFVDLRNYLGYKLMLDPDMNEKVLVDEFMQGFYGAAAKEMKEYYYYLAKRQDEVKTWLGVTHPSRRAFLDAAFFTKVNALLDAAEKKTANDPKRLANVRQERIMVDEAVLYMRDQLVAGGFKALPVAELIKRLEQNYQAAGVKYFPDANERKEAVEKKMTKFKLLANKPPVPKELAGRNIYDYYWSQKTDSTHYTRTVIDKESVTGFAAIPVNHSQDKNFHKHQPSFGVYDKLTKSNLLTFVMPRENIPTDEKYHWVYAGRIKPTAGCIYWLFWTWGIGGSMNDVFNPVSTEKEYDMFVSLKIQGPSYVKGSKKADNIFFDRVIFAEYIDETLTPRTDFGSLESLTRSTVLPMPEEFANRVKVYDWYADQPVESKTSAIVADADAPSKFAMVPRVFIKNRKLHGAAPTFGIYDAKAKKGLLSLSVPPAQRHKDGKYHWFKVGTTKLTPTANMWMHWSWGMSAKTSQAFNPKQPDQLYDVYVYYKTTGPAYGAPGEDGFFVSRVMIFKAEK